MPARSTLREAHRISQKAKRQGFRAQVSLHPLYGRGRIPNSVELPRRTIEAKSLYMMRAASPVFPEKRFGALTCPLRSGPPVK
ncbi:hypothetical protein [Falsiroseomonas sp.]|uniref:hypothetical protein n=1 Tax=Falsiroseomonas sp. TaxID=2870721 RepID=UPI0034A3DF7A